MECLSQWKEKGFRHHTTYTQMQIYIYTTSKSLKCGIVWWFQRHETVTIHGFNLYYIYISNTHTHLWVHMLIYLIIHHKYFRRITLRANLLFIHLFGVNGTILFSYVGTKPKKNSSTIIQKCPTFFISWSTSQKRKGD